MDWMTITIFSLAGICFVCSGYSIYCTFKKRLLKTLSAAALGIPPTPDLK